MLCIDGFRPEFLDFERGIRVGHLEPHQRITQILKRSLEEKYRQPFVTDRWGRGVYWQWICFLPKANRAAKPLSSHVNFGCSKFFIMVDREEEWFKAGMQIERGFLKAPRQYEACRLQEDWDWHRLIQGLGSRKRLYEQIRRLVQEEGFRVHAGSWEEPTQYWRSHFPSAARLVRALTLAPAREWSGFQLYYPITQREVGISTGADLVEAMLAIFDEVTPVMNSCMETQLATTDN